MGSRGEEDSVRRRHLEDWEGKMSMGEPGCPTSVCGRTRRNNWGVRQTEQPRVPERENKASKPLAGKTCGVCENRINSQAHRSICWRDAQDPRTYTKPTHLGISTRRVQFACG